MKTCKTCGFTWKDGEHGSHDCWEVKDARYEALREAAQAVVANAEFDGDISTVDTGDLKNLAALVQEKTKHCSKCNSTRNEQFAQDNCSGTRCLNCGYEKLDRLLHRPDIMQPPCNDDYAWTAPTRREF